jgi:hypothetical protein
MQRVLPLLLAAAVLQGCASHSGRQCEDNFSTQGSFLTGKQFTTYAVLPATPPALAMGNAYKMLAREGFHVESANEKAHVITAYQNVNFSTKTAPINVIIDPAGQGSKVTLTFVAAAGLYTPESSAQSEFCRYIDQVGH